MSTHSFIGRILDDARTPQRVMRFEAAKVTYDGMPSRMGPMLSALVERDGAAVCAATVCRHSCWEMIDADQPRTPSASEQFIVQPGYGVAYRAASQQWPRATGTVDDETGAVDGALADAWYGYLIDVEGGVIHLLVRGEDGWNRTDTITFDAFNTAGEDYDGWEDVWEEARTVAPLRRALCPAA